MRQAHLVTVLLLLFLAAGAFPAAVHACPGCYGDPDSPMTEGMNMAIVSLLGVTGGVLGGVVLFFMHVRRRTHALNRRFKNMLN